MPEGERFIKLRASTAGFMLTPLGMRKVLDFLASRAPLPQLGNRTGWLQLDNYSPYPVAGPCSIGRAKSNSVSIPCEKVSRLHALVHVQERGQHWLLDLGSSNGTYLNGQRVVQPIQLNDGDVILLGDNLIRFLLLPVETDKFALDEAQMTVREMQQVPCWFLIADIENFETLTNTMETDVLAHVMGEWLATCNGLIHDHRGTINQYTGDGFAAYWDGRYVPTGQVADCFKTLKHLQGTSRLPFRLVIHFGKAGIGGSPLMGDAGLFGRDVNFAFSMEELARSLAMPCIISEAAYEGFSKPEAAHSIGMHPIGKLDKMFQFFQV